MHSCSLTAAWQSAGSPSPVDVPEVDELEASDAGSPPVVVPEVDELEASGVASFDSHATASTEHSNTNLTNIRPG